MTTQLRLPIFVDCPHDDREPDGLDDEQEPFRTVETVPISIDDYEPKEL